MFSAHFFFSKIKKYTPAWLKANESTIEESVAGSSERQASLKREPKDQVNGERGKSEPDQETTNAKPHGSSALYAEGQVYT